MALTDDEGAVQAFKELVRIPTISSTGVSSGSYARARDWLVKTCESIGLEVSSHEFVEGKPVVVAVWRGSDDSLRSVLLNSHYDVVPVMREEWHTVRRGSPPRWTRRGPAPADERARRTRLRRKRTRTGGSTAAARRT